MQIANRLSHDSYLRTLTEAAFQAQIVVAARQLGWRVYHTHDSRRSNPGFPDLVLVRSPRVVFAELKKLGGRPSDEQRHWLDELTRCPGVEAYLWRPGDDYAAVLR